MSEELLSIVVHAEVLGGQAGDGHAHHEVGHGQVEDEAPALASLLQEHLQHGGHHQQVGGDDKGGGDAKDQAHLPGPHLT